MSEIKPINTWEPRHLDVVIWHGWFTHWFGIVLEVNRGEISIVKSGLPFLLFQFNDYEMENKKNRIDLPTSMIRNSRGGEYAVLSNNIWYI